MVIEKNPVEIEAWLQHAADRRVHPHRPLVSLCYAQSLDGSIAAQRGVSTPLSGPESSRMTHQLRSLHDAILVGLGTLIADDPLLTARLPELEQKAANPQPVILDSHLSTPLTARVLTQNPKSAWIACLEPPDAERKASLQAAGARLFPLPAGSVGRVSLPALLDSLGGLGIRRLMVEGGAWVISAFLSQGLADALVLTVAPLFMGGLPVLEMPLVLSNPERIESARLREVEYKRLGDDLIVMGLLQSRQ